MPLAVTNWGGHELVTALFRHHRKLLPKSWRANAHDSLNELIAELLVHIERVHGAPRYLMPKHQLTERLLICSPDCLGPCIGKFDRLLFTDVGRGIWWCVDCPKGSCRCDRRLRRRCGSGVVATDDEQ